MSNLKDYRLGQSHFKDYEPSDVFSPSKSKDRVMDNDIVSNLKDYRLGQSHFKDNEPLDVLNGLVKWKDILRGGIGESVSDIDDGDDEG